MVVARTAAAARDAAELVDVDYEELPAALDLKEAAEDKVLAHPDLGTNKSALWVFDSGEAGTGGNVEEAIEKARGDGIVIEREYRQQRLIPAFMEPRSVVVDPTGEQLTMWSATQIPHILRFALAARPGVPESKIRVIAPDVGGGFGGKLQITPEEWIAWWLARQVRQADEVHRDPLRVADGRPPRPRPVAEAHPGRREGRHRDRASRSSCWPTSAPTSRLVGGGVPVLGAFMFNAIYKFPAYQFSVQTVLTNKTWTDAYRGAGRPEATYAIERLMDELAVELGVDPLEIREKNWIKHEEFPFTTVAGLEYDSGNYEEATAKAKGSFGYDELRAEQKQRRESDDPVQLGIGVSTFTEMCGLAPSRVLGSSTTAPAAGSTRACGCSPTGKVEVVTGASAHGQGHETAFSQIVADRLGVPFEDVEILHGDTQVAHRGMDTYGSRSLVVGGEALVRAADKVIEKAKPIAAHMLEANVDDIEFKDGRLGVRGTDQGVGIGEVAMAAFAAHDLPDGVEASLDSDATYDPVNFNFPHGTHLCAVEVDTETGQVKMRKYTCVDDIGNVINPLIVAGQVHGGLMQGIAQALFEEAVHDDAGRSSRRRSSTTSCRRPPTRSASTWTTPPRRRLTNTLGTKGVGEAGTIASTPAVVNAVVDAVRQFGVSDIQMPCTPERVWRAIHAGDAGGADPTTGGAAPHFDAATGDEGQTDRTAELEQASDSRQVRLPRRDLRRGGARGARRERRRQGDRRRPVAAARAPDAAQRARAARRHRRHRHAQGDPRRRRHHR